MPLIIELLLLIPGAAFGFYMALSLVTEEFMYEKLIEVFPFLQSHEIDKMLFPYLWIILALLVALFILVAIINHCTTSLNVKTSKGLAGFFSIVLFGFPFAVYETVVLYTLVLYQWCRRQQSGTPTFVVALVFLLFFGLISNFLIYQFGKKLSAEKKRCRLAIYGMVGNAMELQEVIVKKFTFTDCYNLMRNRGAELGRRQIYRIDEFSASGKKIVAHWRYYQNADFIDIEDEELIQNIKNLEAQENVNWGL